MMKKMKINRNILLLSLFFVIATESLAAEKESLKELWVLPSPAKVCIVEQLQAGQVHKTKIGVRDLRSPDGRSFMWSTRIGRAVSSVMVKDEVYLLFDDGMMQRQSDSYQLASLPKGNRAISFVQDASSGNITVLARTVTVPSTSPASKESVAKPMVDELVLYELRNGVWEKLTALPAGVNKESEISVLRGKKTLEVISWMDSPSKEVYRWTYDGKQWSDRIRYVLPSSAMDVQMIWNGSGIGLVVLEGTTETANGDVLKIYQPVKEKVGYLGTLMVQGEPVKISGPYAVGARGDSTIVGVWASDSGSTVNLAEWSGGGEPVGKVETVHGGGLDKSEEKPSWWYTVLPGMLLVLAVFFRGFTLPGELTLPAEMEEAQYWRRGVAFLIDLIPFVILAGFIWPDYFREIGQRWHDGMSMEELVNSNSSMMLTLTYFTYGMFATYCILMESIYGYTLGKRILGLEVRQVKNTANKPTWQQSILRNVLKVLEVEYLLIVFVIFFTKYRQRIGDMLAGTVVLQVKDKRENR
jgi:uncharacterized RDD family membrane protein YckC